MRRGLAAIGAGLACLHAAAPAMTTGCGPDLPGTRARALTVRDAIGTRRFGQILVSPDGRRYAVTTIRGDLASGRNELDVHSGAIAGSMAVAPGTIARLTTSSQSSASGGEGAAGLTLAANLLQWIPGTDMVVLRWQAADGSVQLFRIDTVSGAASQLTAHPTDVIDFAVTPLGDLLYSARPLFPPGRARTAIAEGFTVPAEATAGDILRGHVDGRTSLDRLYNSERFILRSGAREAVPVADARDRYLHMFHVFSPDGRMVVVDGSPRAAEPWTDYENARIRMAVRSGGFLGRQLWQPYLIDLAGATRRPLLDAPVRGAAAIAWDPSGRWVAIGPTYLPLSAASERGRTGKALVVVDTRSGRYSELPSDIDGLGLPASITWTGTDRLVVHGPSGQLRFARANGRWRQGRDVRPEPVATSRTALSIRQTIQCPPVLVANDPDGRQRLLLDPNPALRTEFALGAVSPISWTASDGLRWNGRLYLPPSFHAGIRYGLVIQTHGIPPDDEFSLYGPGPDWPALGPGASIYSAQALAARGLVVLQVEDKYFEGAAIQDEARHSERAYRAAVELLAEQGIVDRERVGLVGFSRTGWHVGYALTHSEFIYSAALISDNIDANYVQSTLTAQTFEDLYGVRSDGPGMRPWLERAPGFSLDRVRTPVRLQIESPGLETILNQWEWFEHLRRLDLPVELYVPPDIDGGWHGLQNPRQVLAVQEGMVDWFDFWLNGREEPGPAKAAQYERWRGLRERQAQAARRPRRPLLQWQASPAQP